MNIHFGNQSQFELFPGTTGEPIENVAPRFIFSRIVLSFENLVVVFVFIIVSLIVAFSVGVERGRYNVALAHSAAQAAIPVQTSLTPVVPAGARPAQNLAGKPAYPADKSVRFVSGTAEAARMMPAPAPVLPAMGKIALRPGSGTASEKVVDKGYTIQVASYKKESYAQKEAMDLKSQGINSRVMPKGNFLIVCVGRYSSQDEAKGMLNKLKKRYKDCMVRSL